MSASKGPLPASSPFTQVRDAHKTELAEDYVELILDLLETEGEARLTAIALRLGVSHPTVSKSLRKLERDGYVALRPYRSIELTDAGLALAHACRTRHEIVLRFLLSLGLDRDTAERDAEGIEHHVSPKTLEAMDRFATPSPQTPSSR